ncbi:Protocadherin [Candidatus Nitrososphaera evergladensis SR1]|uniref:Protocadherin n=2 Tax=Nitrososphaera TaxID=497726 RepID=A0A075MNP9_9ARCH|nr:Protocadherin [Candidatus Nitrososphaera evergladensis SR1]
MAAAIVVAAALVVSTPLGALAQLSEADIINANISGPVFLDAFWTDRTTMPPAGTPLSKVEVAPGDGSSILAVTLVNRGFSDITSVSGTLSLPSGFTSSSRSSEAVATYNGIVTAGNTFTLFFQVNVSDNASIQSYSSGLKVEYSRTLESGAPRTADINVPFKLTGKVILDASSEGGVAPGTSGRVAIKITNTGSAPATGVVVTVPGSSGVNPTTQQASLVAVGQKSFEIGTITPGNSTTIEPVLYASNSAGETLQTVPLQIEYGNTYGEKKNSTVPVGLIILPTSSSSPLSATPVGNSSIMTAGKITDLRVSLANNGNQQLSDIVASISSTAEQIKILGKTSWTVGDLAPGASQEISTQVYSSTDMIGKAATFKLTVQRISAGQPEIETFDIGTYVDGEISVKAYEIGVTYIGGVPNITGNLLNEGNVLALFTTVEVTSAHGLANSLPPQQYLGDLQENSPLPFSIPIDVANNTGAGTYPVELKVQYKDSLREQHTLDIKANVDFKPEAPAQNTQQSQAGSTMMIGVIAGIIAAVVIAVVVIRMRKKSKLKHTLQFSKQQNGDGSGSNDDIESVLDSHLGSGSKKEEKERAGK